MSIANDIKQIRGKTEELCGEIALLNNVCGFISNAVFNDFENNHLIDTLSMLYKWVSTTLEKASELTNALVIFEKEACEQLKNVTWNS